MDARQLSSSDCQEWTPDQRYRQAAQNAAAGRIRPPRHDSIHVRALAEILREQDHAARRGVPPARRLETSAHAVALRLFYDRSMGTLIESLILGRCSVGLIANLLSLDAFHLLIYRHLFFDVGSRLNAPQTIVEKAIANEASFEGTAAPRRRMAMKMMSYFCGPVPFVDLYSLDKRHSTTVWSLPSTFAQKLELIARLDDMVEMLLGKGVNHTEHWKQTISAQVTEVLGKDFLAYPMHDGELDYLPRAEMTAGPLLIRPLNYAK